MTIIYSLELTRRCSCSRTGTISISLTMAAIVLSPFVWTALSFLILCCSCYCKQ